MVTSGRSHVSALAAPAPSSAASEITKVLTAEILRGAKPAGSPLRQALLAERFAISRTPVREALHHLVALGLATYQPNAGFCVRGISREEYLDAMLIRSRLEGLAAERATRRLTAGQIGELARVLEELHEVGKHLEAAKGSRRIAGQEKWSRGNEHFHDMLVRFAECPPLAAALASTVRAYPRDVTWLAVERYPAALAEYSDDHRGILDALRRSDPPLARARACAHVERTLGYLRLVFQTDDSN